MARYDCCPAEVQALIRSLLHPLDRSLADASRTERDAWQRDRLAAPRRWDPPPIPPDPPHPLEAQLRALLGPDRQVESVALRGRLALTSDGVVWRVGDDWLTAQPVPVPAAPSGSSRVTRMWSTQAWDSVGEAQVAVLRWDGVLLVAGGLLLGGQPLVGGPHPLLQAPAFVAAALEGERVVDVFLTPGQGHVLTRSRPPHPGRGSLWVWGHAPELAAYHSRPAEVPLSAPLRVTAMGNDIAIPSFSDLSVDVHGQAVCAVDDAGGLYAAGPAVLNALGRNGAGRLRAAGLSLLGTSGARGSGWGVGLVPLPPAPAPVRQVLAAVHGCEAQVHAPCTVWPGDHLIALMTDGTLWGLTRRRRLPGATGVTHVRRAGAGVRLHTWDGRDLPFRPAEGQMRAHLAASPGQLVRTVCRGMYALTRDGRVWRAGADGPQQVPVPSPPGGAGGAAAVDRIWGAEHPNLHPHLALRRAGDGALLFSRSGLPTSFWQAQLEGQQPVWVCLTPRSIEGGPDLQLWPSSAQVHVLTAQGSVWAYAGTPGSLLGVGTVGHLREPVRVLQMDRGAAEGRAPLLDISELSVDPTGRVLCAVSQRNRAVYACGPMFRFKTQDAPWPAPMRLSALRSAVRQVLAVHADAPHILASDGDRIWEMRTHGAGDGVLALRADGTLWGLTRHEPLPGIAGVHGLRRDGHTVLLRMADGREEPLLD